MLVTFGSLRSPGSSVRGDPSARWRLLRGHHLLSTVLQQDLNEAVRGKVMALWIMGFGGTVPFGGLLGGWFLERTSIMAMILDQEPRWPWPWPPPWTISLTPLRVLADRSGRRRCEVDQTVAPPRSSHAVFIGRLVCPLAS